MAQGLERLQALVEPGHRVGQEGGALALELHPQLGGRRVGRLEVADVGEHAVAPLAFLYGLGGEDLEQLL